MDLGRVSEETFPAAPELLARLRTFQLVRNVELAFDAIVAIFRLLRSWRENHSQMDAVNDINLYCFAVFDAHKLEWFEQAIRTGLLIESEDQMPTMLEAMIERGVKKGR